MCQAEMYVGISQGLLYQMLLNVLKFCGGGFKKFQAGRYIVKKTFDRDFRPFRETYFSDLFQVAALDKYSGCTLSFIITCQNFKM